MNSSNYPQRLETALGAWSKILGVGNVSLNGQRIQQAENATFHTGRNISAIIRPGNRGEVQACLRIATETGVPVYPICTGKNWGLGSRVPVKDRNVLLDLSRMNRILDFNEELAYVTLEPGVTCRQLHHFLRERGSRHMVALTGSTPDSSLIGNVVERGHAKGPYADRYSFVCGLEVILPNGQHIETGFGRFSGARSTAVSKCGVGPMLEGVFTQSNFGVVTRMTLWLQPRSEHLQTFFFSIQDEAKLPALVNGLRDLRLSGTLRSSVTLLNDHRVQSEIGQFPWDRADSVTPLNPDLFMKLKEERVAMNAWRGVWNGESALYSGTARQAQADRETVEEALAPLVDSLVFQHDTRPQLEALLSRITHPQTGTIDRSQLSYTDCRIMGFAGIPLSGSIPITYWRKKTPYPANLDPDRDQCGIIWCSPTVPFRGDDVIRATRQIHETLSAHGFEPNMCLNGVGERSIDITCAILYDREVAGEDAKAQACYDDLLQRLCGDGYIPYRLTTESMTALTVPADDSLALMRRLKTTLDPSDILAPGRYVPADTHSW